ncbi:MAG: VIT1/CCC1 transporter family protein [Chloroflexi bacterium]|nr:VIT1/CCC1 transporter family protein [Chloroflexota bacterium]
MKSELEAAAVYSVLAGRERDESRAKVFRDLAAVETLHAGHWATKLGLESAALKPELTPRARLVTLLARCLGTRAVLPLILRREFAEIRTYIKEPHADALIGDERRHAIVVHGLVAGGGVIDLLQSEGRHRVGSASNIRAAVLGFNDVLVSLFALITGVAGGTSDPRIIVLAGVAGLLAGAFSMAAGEYLSVRVQRDVYEREVDIERAEIEASPEKEKEELILIYKSKGLTDDEAQVVSKRILANREIALDTMAREELGLDPSQMGSPWGVALSSLTAFCLGAVIPLSPHLLTSGRLALASSVAASAVALVAVGTTLSLLSGKNPVWGGIRMLLIGTASAAVTFSIGRLLGVSIAG